MPLAIAIPRSPTQATRTAVALPRLEVLTRMPTSAPRPGPPLLLIHGAWHGAWCWDDGFAQRLAAQGHEVHAMSLRGHGGSEGGGKLRWTRIRDYVADVARVAAGLREPPLLVAHSMGAFVAQKYLEGRRSPGAALLAPMPHYGVTPTTLRLLRRDPVAVIRSNLTMSLRPVVSTPAKAGRLFFSDSMPASEVERHHARLQDESFLAYLDMMALDLCRPSRVSAPVLVIAAGNDAVFTAAEARAVAGAYGTVPEFRPGMAHDLMLDRGWEGVADRVSAWASSLPVG